MNKTQSFHCPKMSQGKENSLYMDLISSTQNWLEGEGFQHQRQFLEDGGILLQIKKVQEWKKFIGMDTALNIVFRQVDDTAHVEIGEGKWLDKAAAGAVGLLILWPYAVTAGIGAWQQAKMPERIYDHIATFLSQHRELMNNESLTNNIEYLTKEDLFAIIDRYNWPGYYKHGNIPFSKLKNATQSYSIDPNDTIMALIDTTFLGSAKEGIAIGLKGIYFKDSSYVSGQKQFLFWSELVASDIVPSNSNKSYIQLVPGSELYIGGDDQRLMFIKLLKEIIMFNKKESVSDQQETSSTNSSDSVTNNVENVISHQEPSATVNFTSAINTSELKESKPSNSSLSLYVELVPELLAVCISADGLVEESEIEIAMALIENEELIENKQTALESLSLNIDKYSEEKKRSNAIFKLKASSLIAKAANLKDDLYKERLIIIIEGISKTVRAEGLAETMAIIDAIKGKLK